MSRSDGSVQVDTDGGVGASKASELLRQTYLQKEEKDKKLESEIHVFNERTDEPSITVTSFLPPITREGAAWRLEHVWFSCHIPRTEQALRT